MLCAPLLHNAHYATQVRKSVLRIRVIDERRGRYGPILHSSSVQWNMAKVAKFPEEGQYGLIRPQSH